MMVSASGFGVYFLFLALCFFFLSRTLRLKRSKLFARAHHVHAGSESDRSSGGGTTYVISRDLPRSISEKIANNIRDRSRFWREIYRFATRPYVRGSAQNRFLVSSNVSRGNIFCTVLTFLCTLGNRVYTRPRTCVFSRLLSRHRVNPNVPSVHSARGDHVIRSETLTVA